MRGLRSESWLPHLDRAHSFVAKIELGKQELKAVELWDYAHALCADPAELLREVVLPADVPLNADELDPRPTHAAK